MSLNINALASRVVVAGVTFQQATTIVSEVVSLIGVVENVYSGLKGQVKAQAVLSALDVVIEQLGLTDKLTAIKRAVAPLINLIVAILNGASLWASMFGSLISGAEAALKPMQAGAQLMGAAKPDPANTAASQNG